MLGHFIDRNCRWLFPLPAALFTLALIIFPIGYTVWNSFTGWSLTSGTPATFNNFQNYVDLVTKDDRFTGSILRMLYFTAIALTIEIVLGVVSALFLDTRDYRGKNIVVSILLLPMMATPVAVAMVWLLMYEPTAGIINFVFRSLHMPTPLWIAACDTVIPSLALVDIWEWTPIVTLITLAGLASLPQEPFEAAKVDGASQLQRIWHITLPMLGPTIGVAALLRLIDCLKTFDIIYTMTLGGPAFCSETLNIYAFTHAFYYFHFGYASSILVIFFAIVMGLSLLVVYARRWLEERQ